jgi:hypothetical protein
MSTTTTTANSSTTTAFILSQAILREQAPDQLSSCLSKIIKLAVNIANKVVNETTTTTTATTDEITSSADRASLGRLRQALIAFNVIQQRGQNDKDGREIIHLSKDTLLVLLQVELALIKADMNESIKRFPTGAIFGIGTVGKIRHSLGLDSSTFNTNLMEPEQNPQTLFHDQNSIPLTIRLCQGLLGQFSSNSSSTTTTHVVRSYRSQDDWTLSFLKKNHALDVSGIFRSISENRIVGKIEFWQWINTKLCVLLIAVAFATNSEQETRRTASRLRFENEHVRETILQIALLECGLFGKEILQHNNMDINQLFPPNLAISWFSHVETLLVRSQYEQARDFCWFIGLPQTLHDSIVLIYALHKSKLLPEEMINTTRQLRDLFTVKKKISNDYSKLLVFVMQLILLVQDDVTSSSINHSELSLEHLFTRDEMMLARTEIISSTQVNNSNNISTLNQPFMLFPHFVPEQQQQQQQHGGISSLLTSSTGSVASGGNTTTTTTARILFDRLNQEIVVGLANSSWEGDVDDGTSDYDLLSPRELDRLRLPEDMRLRMNLQERVEKRKFESVSLAMPTKDIFTEDDHMEMDEVQQHRQPIVSNPILSSSITSTAPPTPNKSSFGIGSLSGTSMQLNIVARPQQQQQQQQPNFGTTVPTTVDGPSTRSKTALLKEKLLLASKKG